MTFICTLPAEVVSTILRSSGIMWLISKPTGEILDASPEFMRWIGYTHDELLRLTWMQISAQDDSLRADMHAVKDLTPYDPFFIVRKQYIPKNDKPSWGELMVTRHPMQGDHIEYCFCTWHPLKNGTAEAFAKAMENGLLVEKRLNEMTTVLNSITSQSEEDRYVLSTINMIRKHPKVAAAFVVIALGMFGLNNTLEFLQRTGIIEIPIRVEQQSDAKSGVGDIRDHSIDIARHY